MSTMMLLSGLGLDISYILIQLRYDRRSLTLICTYSVLHVVTCIVLLVNSLALQRRPDVYWNGDRVDRQFTGSAIQRCVHTGSNG